MHPRRSSLQLTAARREAAGWAVLWWMAVTAVCGVTHLVERGLS